MLLLWWSMSHWYLFYSPLLRCLSTALICVILRWVCASVHVPAVNVLFLNAAQLLFCWLSCFCCFEIRALASQLAYTLCQCLTYFLAKTTWHSHAPECGTALVLVFWIMTSFQVRPNSIVLLCVCLNAASIFSLKLSSLFIIFFVCVCVFFRITQLF